MPTQISGQVGPQLIATGVGTQPIRQGNLGETIVSELHGRFFEQNLRLALFSGGMGLTSISNVTFTTGTLGATCTPIAGVWNPLTSQVNLVILQAMLGITVTALQATGAAPFAWAGSFSNAALTLGGTPINRRTLQAGPSATKNMAGVALTGLTNNLVVFGASSLGGGSYSNAAFLATAVGPQAQQVSFVENLDGQYIVPPGGVLALLATTTPVAHSAASMLLWEEVPVIT
jgi:hypothetical protein